MARELASSDSDDLSGFDTAEIERATAHVPATDLTSLPSFKRLPPHRRADRGRPGSADEAPANAALPQRRPAMREPEPAPMRVPQPPQMPVPKPPWLDMAEGAPMTAPLPLTRSMHLAAMRMMGPMPPRTRRRLPWRAAALLLVGSALGAAAALTLLDPPPDSGTVVASKYLTVLPAAAPAAPPPQIVYVDKWRIVSPEPRLLQPYEMLPPALPAAPPPQIVMIERATAPAPPRRIAESKRSPAVPPRAETKARPPEAQPEQGDVAKELERWLSGR